MNKQDKIKEIEMDLEIEQMQYDICCENPTYTSQFRIAQEKHGLKIERMKNELYQLKLNK